LVLVIHIVFFVFSFSDSGLIEIEFGQMPLIIEVVWFLKFCDKLGAKISLATLFHITLSFSLAIVLFG
jgi:hypothetical protein